MLVSTYNAYIHTYHYLVDSVFVEFLNVVKFYKCVNI